MVKAGKTVNVVMKTRFSMYNNPSVDLKFILATVKNSLIVELEGGVAIEIGATEGPKPIGYCPPLMTESEVI